ncbi:hypothetical protein GFL39_18390 [Rhizobium leguminosarum bv. viciae]|nr:hypothetical protein [Rhizobium leguminosarum bv. viciae]NKL91286.1 hypothetical protein [Rhizobium leguminosarum bv. viciae]NKM91609.1 hypothetical protein [Rhizobium leguminosarum bv. viciae]
MTNPAELLAPEHQSSRERHFEAPHRGLEGRGGCSGITPTSLIPVLVTGIQPRRVRAVNESIPQGKKSLAPKDLGALDSCDEHRNEEGEAT